MHSLMVSASATCPVHWFSNPATTTYASGSSLLSWSISSFTFMGYLYVFVYFITLNGRANNCSETKKFWPENLLDWLSFSKELVNRGAIPRYATSIPSCTDE
nr:hypothetical protein [Morganella morganii]